jgi:hypothetical protein
MWTGAVIAIADATRDRGGGDPFAQRSSACGRSCSRATAAPLHNTGTNLGAVDGGPPPTGKSFAARQSHWFRIADGQLAEHWATRDDLSALLQVGVIKRPGPPAG